MKRERIEKKADCIFADIPTDLYPLLMGNYTREVEPFRQWFSLRRVSSHFRVNIDYVFAQIRELAQPIVNLLFHDRQLALLPRLTRLNLRWNRRITNTGIAQLSALTRLTMRRGGSCSLEGLDKLSGTLTCLSMRDKYKWQPVELSLLTGLRRLNLTGSIIETDYLVMTALTHLREVKTNGADYRFTHLTMLSMLDFRDLDKEEDTVAMSFSNLTSLRLSGPPQTDKPWFCLLSSLTRLELVYWSSMSDFTLPTTLTRLSMIGWMGARGHVQDNALCGLTNLRRLSLRQSIWFTDNALLHVPQLEHLDLSFTTNIHGEALVRLASSLRRLNLKECTSITDAYLSQMTGLTHLTVMRSGGIGEAGLLSLTGLRTLICGAFTISDQCLSGFTSLTSLELHPVYVHGKSLHASLGLMTRLERLVIAGVRGRMTVFPSLPRLKSLIAPRLMFGRDQLLCCPVLTHVECVADENSVCGDFDHLPRLQSLSLSYRSLSDSRASYLSLTKLRDKGIILSCSYQ